MNKFNQPPTHSFQSSYVRVNSTSVDTDIIKGPNFPGSYVVGIIMYPSGLPSRTNSLYTSFHGTNF